MPRRLAVCLALLAYIALLSTAHAAPNDGGVLLLHFDSNLVYSQSPGGACGAALPPRCETAVNFTRDDDVQLLSILAAFASNAEPRVASISVGLFVGSSITVYDWGSCADSVETFGDWPESGSGVRFSWSAPRTRSLFRIGWLAVARTGVGPDPFVELRAHPGGEPLFVDDAVPPNVTADGDLGSAGFTAVPFATCPNGQKLLGACCVPVEGCFRLSKEDCAARSRYATFLPEGRTCDPEPCTELGACCFESRVCLRLNDSDCAEQGGYFVAGSGCERSGPCAASRLGGCCFDDGTCRALAEVDCQSAHGAFQGVNTRCEASICPPGGACCLPNGECRALVESVCAELPGSWLGAGVACDPLPCPQPPGGCCLPDTTCEVREQGDCVAAGGRFLLYGEGCPPEPCAPLGMGACCVGCECRIATFEDCTRMEGWWLESYVCDHPGCYCGPVVAPSSWGKIKARYRDLPSP